METIKIEITNKGTEWNFFSQNFIRKLKELAEVFIFSPNKNYFCQNTKQMNVIEWNSHWNMQFSSNFILIRSLLVWFVHEFNAHNGQMEFWDFFVGMMGFYRKWHRCEDNKTKTAKTSHTNHTNKKTHVFCWTPAENSLARELRNFEQ